MILDALTLALGDLFVGLALATFAAAVIGLLVWHSKREKRRAEERGEVWVEVITPAFQWPAKKRAVADFASDHKTRTRVGL